VVEAVCDAAPWYGYICLWTPPHNSVIDKIVMNAQFLWKTQLKFPIPFSHNAFYVTAFSAKIMSWKFYQG
jgi:hypothetical protein